MKDNINNVKPVFVIGTGRCGLSPLMDLIAYHPDFAWPSQFNEMFPKYYRLSMLSRLVDIPLVRRLPIRNRYFPPHHTEAFRFYNQQFLGFAQPFRDLVADDVTPLVKSKFQDAVHQIMRYQGKTHFIAEYSGWSRIGFLKAIFPEAKFIHIVRDGRAVANSLTNIWWWLGWEGVYRWRWGVPNQDLLEKLERYDNSFLALAAVHWKILINNILEQSQLLADQDVMVVRYEDMVQDPYGEANRCIEFCGLEKDHPRFRKHLPTVKIVNANTNKFRIPAWRENLSQKQLDMLDDLLEDDLIYFNYLAPKSNHDREKDLATLGQKEIGG